MTAEAEKNLLQVGAEHGLSKEQMLVAIEAELKDSGAKRAVPTPPPTPPAAEPRRRRGNGSLNPGDDFLRMLRLSGLDSDSMTDDQRDAFINMAENLGIEPADAEDMVDVYLDEADALSNPEAPAAASPRIQVVAEAPVARATPAAPAEATPAAPAKPETAAAERAQFINFENSVGASMLLVPSGEFVMGSDSPEATPNERPMTRVTLTRYYLSRYPITNAQYEQFDGSHVRRRAPGTGDNHPVVYVSSLEAIKFCQWLSTREHKKYRLPTEAEWEYAARGTDGRKYPWGNYDRRGDLANFADKNTVFAWSDRDIDDGYAETSPVGAFPLGTSPFGMGDMAGNVWEWCFDYYEPYRGVHRINPRGPTCGPKRVYRGGSWKSRFTSLRATARSANVPSYSCNDLGFRVACECD